MDDQKSQNQILLKSKGRTTTILFKKLCETETLPKNRSVLI